VLRATLVSGIALLCVVAVPPARSQLSVSDDSVLAPQPTMRLAIQPSLLHRLNLLAAGLDREVVLCLQGHLNGDTAAVDEFVMPDLVNSMTDGVAPLPCGPATLAVWHNHPWTGADSAFGIRVPADFCSLSEPDIRTVVAGSIPFAVVSVGRAGRPIVCWWRRVQVVVNRRVKYLPRFPGQWRELPP
jgi:hypothetical protein